MRKLLAGLGLGLGAAAVVLLLGTAGLLDTLELKAYDWRMRLVSNLRAAAGRPLAHPGIVLVEINDATLRELKPLVGRWPWPRALMAFLVDFLRRGEARTIAIDFGYWEPEREATYPFLGDSWTSAQSDSALAESVRRAGNVILLADAVDPGTVDGDVVQRSWRAPPYRLGSAIEPRPVITVPYDGLAEAARGFGHNFLALDPDGPARRVPPFVRQGDRYMAYLGLAAGLAAAEIPADEVVLEGYTLRAGDRRIPLVPIELTDSADPRQRREQLTMLINYRAGAAVDGAPPYATYEARDLLRSEGQILAGEKPDIDPAAFRGKVVFVGLNASGLVDVFQTPFGQGVVPGIQIHASVADSLLSNSFLRPASAGSRVAATIGLALAVAAMAVFLPFWMAAAGSLLAAIGWIALSVQAFSGGVWLNLSQPVLAGACALFAGTAYRYFVEDAEKRRVSKLFGRYVSKDVYHQLLSNPGLAELGGGRREMSVLFSDIRGFTSITEGGDPEALVGQLNEYFTRMVDIVFRHGGTLDKFVGDMVMALFGAPVDDERHADHAVDAAVEMVGALGELNARWQAEGRLALDIGIGVNSGEMIAGNIGSSAIMSYTVIGDNVNLGSRLESLNKEYGTRIIISEATRAGLTRQIPLVPLGTVVVKGKTRPVEIFEVVVPSPVPERAGRPAAEETRS